MSSKASGKNMRNKGFSDIETSVSFYTRNDFAILNSLLTDNADALWEAARLAYADNKGILDEYASGVRKIKSRYDKKWMQILKERVIDTLDDSAKERIVQTARWDIENILGAMKPAKEKMLLYRTAWVANGQETDNSYPFARHLSLSFGLHDCIEIHLITSASLTPYREDDMAELAFYRYEITVPKGALVLELDRFECHNEVGEVLLPPMRCAVRSIRGGNRTNCRGIIELEYLPSS